MTTLLTGDKPLWPDLGDYVKWVKSHAAEIHASYKAGDEYAGMIVEATVKLTEMMYADTPPTDDFCAAYSITVERYIAQWHPDIAVIEAKS